MLAKTWAAARNVSRVKQSRGESRRSRILPAVTATLCLTLVLTVIPAAPFQAPAHAQAPTLSLSPIHTLHADGAELEWTFTGDPTTFQSYEVHRDRAANFTPSAATLIATLKDVEEDHYRDTTAAASSTFTYRIVTGGLSSTPQTVTLPAAGKSTKTLQPGPTEGRATYINVLDRCLNAGARSTISIGGEATNVNRGLVVFDIGDIPSHATVDSATIALYHPQASQEMTVSAHKVSSEWTEGSGMATCTGDGVTWNEVAGGVEWETAGGDHGTIFDQEANAQLESAGWDDFDATALVQDWIDGDASVFGVMFKGQGSGMPSNMAGPPTGGEGVEANPGPETQLPGQETSGTEAGTSESSSMESSPVLDYAADDHSTASWRPKLTISYTDGSTPVAPTVDLTSPTGGSTVKDTVSMAAEALDDGKVSKVEFFVDSTLRATDTSAPFSYPWDTSAASFGAHTLQAKAHDDAGNITSTPTSTVTVDNSAAPATAITAPGAGPAVSGRAVAVSASATDNSAIARVEFYANGNLIGTDSSAPYTTTWDTQNPSSPAYNGSHTLTSKAVTDTGQATTSAGVNLTVDNDATADSRYGAQISLNGLDPADDDGEIPLAIEQDRATPTADTCAGSPSSLSSGSETQGGSEVTEQSSSSSFSGTFEDSGDYEQCRTQAADPSKRFHVDVTLKNTGSTPWTPTDTELWYRWLDRSGGVVFQTKAAALPASVTPGGQQPMGFDAYHPVLATGDLVDRYRLRIDLLNTSTGQWFAAHGNAPSDNPVVINHDLDTALGLERYYHYDTQGVGAGMTHMVNLANGNSILNWTPWTSPGRGLSTVLSLTYNSLEQSSDSPLGHNFSLAVSGLTRFGRPLDIGPNEISFVDADGTPHTFTKDVSGKWKEPPGVNLYLRQLATSGNESYAITRPDRVTFYFDDKGYPRSITDKDGNRLKFELEDITGGNDGGPIKKRITAVVDAAGTSSQTHPQRAYKIAYHSGTNEHVRGQIKSITDHAGRELAFDYYLDGNLRKITQLGGHDAGTGTLASRSFVFTYVHSGGRDVAIRDASNAFANSDSDAHRALRLSAPEDTREQSTRLFSVFDPRGNETIFDYYMPDEPNVNSLPSFSQLKWKLERRLGRRTPNPANPQAWARPETKYLYFLDTKKTEVRAPEGRTSAYLFDNNGKVTSLTNPHNETTLVEWNEADFTVKKVTEPKTGVFTAYLWNANGYPTSIERVTDAATGAKSVTTLQYNDIKADAQDPGFHVSDLVKKTDPNGNASTAVDDFTWRFAYYTDAGGVSTGDLKTVTDPENKVTTYTWNADGTLATIDDAMPGRPVTQFLGYDASGLPTEVRDPLGNTTRMGYDPDGLVLWTQDPNHGAFGPSTGPESYYKTMYHYDSFKRLGRVTTPKSTQHQPGELIFSGTKYDPNDNVRYELQPSYVDNYGSADPQLATEMRYNELDLPVDVYNPEDERTNYVYDLAGRVTKLTEPKGLIGSSTSINDYATSYKYDLLDRVEYETRYFLDTAGVETPAYTFSCYEAKTGDLKSVTAPNALKTPETFSCTTPGTHTTKYDFDDAHRPLSTTDALGRSSSTRYDANGNQVCAINQHGDHTKMEYDQRNLLVKRIEPFAAVSAGPVKLCDVTVPVTSQLTTAYAYDEVGNVRKIVTPRAWDAAGRQMPADSANFVTLYGYDHGDRLVKTTLPKATSSDPHVATAAAYEYRTYDANGNLTEVTLPDQANIALPVTAASLDAVPQTKHTRMTYWDPGWIRTSDDNPDSRLKTPDPSPVVSFDYHAPGWQASRSAVRKRDGKDFTETFTWRYFVDGQLRERQDGDNQFSTFSYDANNSLKAASVSGAAENATKPITITAETEWRNLPSRVTSTRTSGASTTTFESTFRYDASGNLTRRVDGGRVSTFTYDDADWLAETNDLGDDGCKDNYRVVTDFTATGWEDLRRTYAGYGIAGGCDDKIKQTMDWDYFSNGKLKQLDTRRGGPGGTAIESHALTYRDSGGVYVNGNRVKDTFTRAAPASSTAPCQSSTCTHTYTFDGRDRLTKEVRAFGAGAGGTTEFTLDEVGNTKVEKRTPTSGTAITITSTYEGSRLVTRKVGADPVRRHHYDSWGNLDCVTKDTVDPATACKLHQNATSTSVYEDYTYDHLNRLRAYRAYNITTGARSDHARYFVDPLERVYRERENHEAWGSTYRVTDFFHSGLSDTVAKETLKKGTEQTVTKTYSFDAYGHRIALNNDDPNKAADTGDFLYGYDVHGNVSQLSDVGTRSDPAATTVEGSYGYTPHGEKDTEVTKGDAGQLEAINYYRYAGKRLDTGNQGYFTGSRQYGPQTGRFLQQDVYMGALNDLSLSLDPLTQNRYGLAGGNPVSYVESDGHVPEGDLHGTVACGDCKASPVGPPEQADVGGPLGFVGDVLEKVAGRVDALVRGIPDRVKQCTRNFSEDGMEVPLDPCGFFKDTAQAFADNPQQFAYNLVKPYWEAIKTGDWAGLTGLLAVDAILARGVGKATKLGGTRGSVPTPAATRGISRLPAYAGGKTQGILQAGSKEIDLISGWGGPAAQLPRGSAGFDIVTKSHVEGHAAAIMRMEGLEQATLYINQVPCASCARLLPRMLPQGAELTIHGPNNFMRVFRGQ